MQFNNYSFHRVKKNVILFTKNIRKGCVCFREDILGLFSVHNLYENILCHNMVTEISSQQLAISYSETLNLKPPSEN